MLRKFGFFAMTLIGTHACFGETFRGLPEGFVYLRSIDPTILQDMRYATAANFTGAIVPGYKAGECVLLREVAEALREVQKDLRTQNVSLKVYDCYRPIRAVKSFVAWAQGAGGEDPSHYPRERRDQLIKHGYIGAVSSHSTGTAVDLTIVPLPSSEAKPEVDKTYPHGSCISTKEEREPDNSVDMGTGIDCFDKKSYTLSPEITSAQSAMRQDLVCAMSKRGFQNYYREWWHFSFPAADTTGKAYDFIITEP